MLRKESSFVELAKYLQDPPKANRSAWALLRLRTVIRKTLLDAARYDIEPTQRLRALRATRLIPCHFQPSWRKPSQEVLDAAEERICEAMGYADHQRVSAVHYDTDNVHIHIFS
ncbi:relaxase/mobilization nuclease domain-containing protein [Klebsiella quasipneumoniae]|uniref:relaxase/mobilization nuclease domain-containing protein n=1 Tax=Klebsiella quasipneumoniae TaxID=1463165 RepID=UPI0038906FAF